MIKTFTGQLWGLKLFWKACYCVWSFPRFFGKIVFNFWENIQDNCCKSMKTKNSITRFPVRLHSSYVTRKTLCQISKVYRLNNSDIKLHRNYLTSNSQTNTVFRAMFTQFKWRNKGQRFQNKTDNTKQKWI